MNYVNQHALVLGLGESGLAMAQWLVYCGARVRVADTRPESALAERLAQLRAAAPAAEFVGGQPLTAALLDGIDFVAVSPGLAPQRELAEIAAAAALNHQPLWGEMELFAQALTALRAERAYAPKVLAITGTNGKTTVTSLTGNLCRRAGLTTKVAGNISPAVLDVLRGALIEDAAHAEQVAAEARLQAEQDAAAAALAQAAAREQQEQEQEQPQVVVATDLVPAQLTRNEQPVLASDAAAAAEPATESASESATTVQAATVTAAATLSVAVTLESEAQAVSEESTGSGPLDTAAAADAGADLGADAHAQTAGELHAAIQTTDTGHESEPESRPAIPAAEDAPEEVSGVISAPDLMPPEPVQPVYTGILPQAWVLELSSFQLHTTYSLQPDAATVLNVTQDHLDWHGSLEAYAADKARIFGAQTLRVLNRDDALVMRMTGAGAPVLSFGQDEPLKAGDFGLVDDNGMLWLANAAAIEEEEKPQGRRRKDKEVAAQPFVLKRLMPVDALRIRGLHNALNALAALALCRAVDLPLAPLLHGLREYTGEPHRVELVTTIQDVEYYDDSKGTNVGATVAALNGLGHGGKPNRLLLIAGGDGKGQDFAPLAEPLAKYGRAVFLIGRDAAAIRSAVTASAIELIDCDSLEQAVERAGEMAQAGDAVLLSPACASLDMFRNYAHRAEVFIDAVRELALSRGEVM